VGEGDINAAGNAEAESPETQTVEQQLAEREAELAALQQKFADVSRQLAEADLRAQAEVQNMRRRMEREVGNAHKFALDKFSADLLAVADNLERGLAAAPADDEALKSVREGVELTLKSLTDVFARYGIEAVDPKGGQFDPQLHEAMATVPMPGADENSVIEVLEKGYSLNGRLIRPARVVVAKNS
jgi:molecular chaperone GrpE